MTTEKPIINRVYVTLKDGRSGQQRCFTIYDATIPDVVGRLTPQQPAKRPAPKPQSN